ncbi:MAG: hypothetical protein LBE75_00025 [Burkholderiales bacterium]|jgi:hypothetical protein|nr:hypothetical protein [Burkholderiales bacterium]
MNDFIPKHEAEPTGVKKGKKHFLKVVFISGAVALPIFFFLFFLTGETLVFCLIPIVIGGVYCASLLDGFPGCW